MLDVCAFGEDIRTIVVQQQGEDLILGPVGVAGPPPHVFGRQLMGEETLDGIKFTVEVVGGVDVDIEKGGRIAQRFQLAAALVGRHDAEGRVVGPHAFAARRGGGDVAGAAARSEIGAGVAQPVFIKQACAETNVRRMFGDRSLHDLGFFMGYRVVGLVFARGGLCGLFTGCCRCGVLCRRFAFRRRVLAGVSGGTAKREHRGSYETRENTRCDANTLA